MEFKEFKVMHSEIIMYCQLIEEDIKWIYSYMHKGNKFENRNSLDTKSMGQMIAKLKELDREDDNHFLTDNDYNYLKQMKDKRNYWCHQAFVDFMYLDDFIYSSEYKRICDKLQRDHDKLSILCDNIEHIKLEAKKVYNR